MSAPSRDTIEYGRRAVERVVVLLDQMSKSPNIDSADRKEGYRRASRLVEDKLCGSEGCVISAFDKRWLDDDFRQTMATAYWEAEK